MIIKCVFVQTVKFSCRIISQVRVSCWYPRGSPNIFQLHWINIKHKNQHTRTYKVSSITKTTRVLHTPKYLLFIWLFDFHWLSIIIFLNNIISFQIWYSVIDFLWMHAYKILMSKNTFLTCWSLHICHHLLPLLNFMFNSFLKSKIVNVSIYFQCMHYSNR